MTAPTQPPDPRVQRIASAMGTWQHTPGDQSHVDLARVLVEELGGREVVKFATAEYDMRIDGWNKVCQALWSAYPNMDAAMQAAPVHDRPALAIHQLAESLNACRAQQRENAETIAALKERVEMAEAANTELDNARKSAEQSARDLRENNATLRAELDAIKGAQPRFGSFRDGILSIHGTFKNDDRFDIYRHPAPAQPVVVLGEVFVFPVAGVKHVSTRWIAPWDSLPEGRYEFTLGAPLSTEGGK